MCVVLVYVNSNSNKPITIPHQKRKSSARELSKARAQKKKTNQINHFIFSLHNEQLKTKKKTIKIGSYKNLLLLISPKEENSQNFTQNFIFSVSFKTFFVVVLFELIFFFSACRVIFRFGFDFVQQFPALPFAHKRSAGRRERFSLALAEGAREIDLKRLRSKRSRERKKIKSARERATVKTI